MESRSISVEEDIVEIKKDDTTPLQNHIAYFGGVAPKEEKKEEKISWNTTRKQHEKLGSSKLASGGLAFMDMLFNGSVVGGCPFRKFYASDAVAKLYYPKGTGIFTKDGSINEERWNELKEYSELYDGKIIITKSQFDNFLNDCREADQESDPLGVYKAINNAEWVLFWDKFYNGKSESGEKYISLNRLRKFYENSQVVGEKYEHKLAHGNL